MPDMEKCRPRPTRRLHRGSSMECSTKLPHLTCLACQFKVTSDQVIALAKIQATVTVAEIGAKTQSASDRAEFTHDAFVETHNTAHELAMAGVQNDQANQQQASQQGHEAAQDASSQNAAAQQQQSAQDAAAQQAQQQQGGE